MIMLRFISGFVLFLFFTVKLVNADCNFKTGRYINELQDPSYIKSINISVPKSAKYMQNALRIITSRTMNIPPNLRKNFYANITVDYVFGTCTYSGKVRQSGDIKDHISMLSGGFPVRSLKVKLNTGNIVSAVHFKLLLPATRNGLNEILTSLILKRIGIISPETFAVRVKVNNVSTVMLFQEDARKELLEKNNRRESAIFEGDEELLWSFEDYALLELKNLSLSKLVNDNWFKKGRFSQDVTLRAFSYLQRNYAKSALRDTKSIGSINLDSSHDLSEYVFLLAGMHGFHAFSRNNRKFYFDPIQSKFEPIYYDGNTDFKKLNTTQLNEAYSFLAEQSDINISANIINRLIDILNDEELKVAFLKRAEPLVKYGLIDSNPVDFLDTSRSNYIVNTSALFDKLRDVHSKTDIVSSTESIVERYLKVQEEYKLQQTIFTKLIRFKDGYIATLNSGEQVELSENDVADLISKNRLNNERSIFLGDYISLWDAPVFVNKPEIFVGKVVTSPAVKVSISETAKVLKFVQTYPNDWALIQDANLNDWTIVFQGVKKKSANDFPSEQNFNEYGLTGCLNFYKTTFQSTKIDVSDGFCEDSVNIIASHGTIDYILAKNAFSDGIDIDFSKISLGEVNVQNAGNDCIDVSGGNYDVDALDLLNCKDKGVSVGEKSEFFAEKIMLTGANIGISSKDYSKTKILEVITKKVVQCIEVKQKKQEFGGALLWLGKIVCTGDWDVDKNSVYLEGSL